MAEFLVATFMTVIAQGGGVQTFYDVNGSGFNCTYLTGGIALTYCTNGQTSEVLMVETIYDVSGAANLGQLEAVLDGIDQD